MRKFSTQAAKRSSVHAVRWGTAALVLLLAAGFSDADARVWLYWTSSGAVGVMLGCVFDTYAEIRLLPDDSGNGDVDDGKTVAAENGS